MLMINMTQLMVWLKVNDVAHVQYQRYLVKEPNKEPDKKYYDFMSGKFYTKKELVKLAEKNGYRHDKY